MVSVIVPVYNAGAALETCLDSLANQTLADIEIIVVNDASTDGSPGIIEGFAAADSRFRVLSNGENLNLFETRRGGFAAARGAYVAACDSDDYMPGTALERLYETARREEADIVHGRVEQLAGGRRLEFYFGSPFKASSGRAFVESLLRFGRGWNVWGKLYRRAVVEKGLAELPANKRLFQAEDLLFSVFFGLEAGPYAACPEIVYGYRFNEGNYFSQPEKWPSQVADHFQVLALIKARLEKNGLPAEYDRLFKRLARKTAAGVFANLPAGADRALARALITERLPCLEDIYGADFRRSPLGDDYEKAGGRPRFFRRAARPGALVLFTLTRLWENGFYESLIRFRQALTIIRRDGYKQALEKMKGRLMFCA
ncbi:MAG: glycosyltransferase [Candidatus Adiutrix sp.]|nr:glycosyltransferase [Candidatus Adiutrix sp.]